MDMLWDDFYPTPKEQIWSMLSKIDFQKINSILEPSAGRGDLAEALRSRCENQSRKNIEIDVIEINPELQDILRAKEFRLIHDDFLTYQGRKHYDVIVANFPFSDGDKHLAKALDLLEEYGGSLICLVNANTIRNPFSVVRQANITRLETLGAQIVYKQQVFQSAARKTDVEIAEICVSVERKTRFSLVLDHLQQHEFSGITASESPDQLVSTDYREALIQQFNQECTLGLNLLREFTAIQSFLPDRFTTEEDKWLVKPILQLRIGDERARFDAPNLAGNVNEFLCAVRKKYWCVLFRDPRFRCNYTSNILKELERKEQELLNYDFTLFNIREIETQMRRQIVKGIEQAILDLFDKCSVTHCWGEDFSKNIHYYNGWKTNKAHKINKRVIIPFYNALDTWGRQFGNGTKLNYSAPPLLIDMVKVFQYLDGQPADVPRLVGQVIERATKDQNFDLDLRYFKIKLYQKGTAHITFTRPDLLAKFNIFGSQRKNWLPPRYGKAVYDDLSPEERQTIDGFQGKAEYEKVVAEPDKYIIQNHQLLLNS